MSELQGEDFGELLPETFDAILVDAPCSGEGNCRRDRLVLERWRFHTEGREELLRRQAKLLSSAWSALKPGGYMVYSTCTLNYFENELQCQQFVSSVFDAHMVDLSLEWGSLAGEQSSYLRLWPHSFDTEGFFVAAFRKRPNPNELVGPPRSKPCRFPAHLRLLDWRRIRAVRVMLRSKGLTSLPFFPASDQVLVEDDQMIYLSPRLPNQLDPLLATLKVAGFPIASKHGDKSVASRELLVWAGDRCPRASAMTAVDWASLEVSICDTLAARNAHMSLLAAEGRATETYEAFSCMCQQRLRPDGASFSALVTALAQDRQEVFAHEVSLSTKVPLRRESFNKVLNAFALQGDDGSVRGMISAMGERTIVPDVVSFNILLKSLGVKKAIASEEEALKLLDEMTSRSVTPNKISYSTLMSCMAQKGDAKSVESLFHLAKGSGVDVGVFGFNILIQAHMLAFDLPSARAVMRRMREECLKPDVVTYTTLMKGQTEDIVTSLFQEMQDDLVHPNSVSLTNVISTLTRAQQLNAAMDIASKTAKCDLHERPLSSHLACAILHLCGQVAEVDGHSTSATSAFAIAVFQRVAKPDAACRQAYAKVIRSFDGEKSSDFVPLNSGAVARCQGAAAYSGFLR